MTARTGMTDLITELRARAQAGTSEYTLGSQTYFSDDHLQDVLDQYRVDYYDYTLVMKPRTDQDGNARYYDYYFPRGWWEKAAGGTAVWLVQDSTGDHVGTANYTPDYLAGLVRFSADQGGTSYFLTARRYDMDRAAAHVWRQKAANVATRVTWSTDNHRQESSKLYKQYQDMALFYDRQAGGAARMVRRNRSDVNA
jgi:hypothetical protein